MQLCLAMALILPWSTTGPLGAGGKAVERADKPSTLLRYSAESEKRTYRLSEPIQIKVTMTNISATKVAVFEGELFRYCNYERLPKTEDGFSTEGQITGDSPGGAQQHPPTVLAPKESLVKTLDLHRLLKDLAREPGKYRISFDYCHDGPETVDGIAVPTGCVRSNDILLEVARADRT